MLEPGHWSCGPHCRGYPNPLPGDVGLLSGCPRWESTGAHSGWPRSGQGGTLRQELDVLSYARIIPKCPETLLYLLPRQHPTFPRERSDRTGFERLIEGKSLVVVCKPIGHERQRQLRRATAAVAP